MHLPCAHQVGGYSFCLVHRLVHRLVRRLVQLWLMYFASAGTLCKGLVCLGFALCRPCATRKSSPWLFWHLRTAPNFTSSRAPCLHKLKSEWPHKARTSPCTRQKYWKKPCAALCGFRSLLAFSSKNLVRPWWIFSLSWKCCPMSVL